MKESQNKTQETERTRNEGRVYPMARFYATGYLELQQQQNGTVCPEQGKTP